MSTPKPTHPPTPADDVDAKLVEWLITDLMARKRPEAASVVRDVVSRLQAADARIAELTGLLNTAKQSATLIAKDLGERRIAAKKLLCDICACSAETDPTGLDLPHVVKDCLEPLETLIAERDACLFMATQTRRFLGQDGPMVLDAIGEAAAAKAQAALVPELMEALEEEVAFLQSNRALADALGRAAALLVVLANAKAKAVPS